MKSFNAMSIRRAACLVAWLLPTVTSFTPTSHIHHNVNSIRQSPQSTTSTTLGMSSTEAQNEEATNKSKLKTNIQKLKKTLYREYTTFFEEFADECYAEDVTFSDPMTDFTGVARYKNNVDMLAGRTLMGKILGFDAGIILHSVSGGEIQTKEDGTAAIDDIITRWTLRLTMNILPWKPTARFSGISVYEVKETNETPTSNLGIEIQGQLDYWDSINIIPRSGGEYKALAKSVGISDFIDQVKPGGFQAQTAAPELPYQLLRRGDGYEIREYPSYTGVRLPYSRRDEGFGSLGAFTRGMDPLGPSIMEVQKDDISDKYMLWPLTFQQPDESEPSVPKEAIEKKEGMGQWRTMNIITRPTKVVAVREFSDASMEPVIRKEDRELRSLLERDGLIPVEGSENMVTFAQYDAIFSMGDRKSVV